MNEITKHIEALLFVAGEPVAKNELSELLGAELTHIEEGILELKQSLREHGLAVTETDTHVQLVTSPEVADLLAQFLKEEPRPLSKAAAETLAIIAYRGPVSRYDIDVLRGVDSRTMVRQLLRRGIIKQSASKGNTILYDVSEDFLLHVGLEHKEELPQFAALSKDEKIQQLLEGEENV